MIRKIKSNKITNNKYRYKKLKIKFWLLQFWWSSDGYSQLESIAFTSKVKGGNSSEYLVWLGEEQKINKFGAFEEQLYWCITLISPLHSIDDVIRIVFTRIALICVLEYRWPDTACRNVTTEMLCIQDKGALTAEPSTVWSSEFHHILVYCSEQNNPQPATLATQYNKQSIPAYVKLVDSC